MAKRPAPDLSLVSLLLACALPDVLFCAFLLAGIESVHIQSGITAVNPLDLYDIAISHSLLTTAVWGGIMASFYGLRTRAGCVVFELVFSHWFLDFVSHRPDMPLIPGSEKRFGLGFQNSLAATFLVEGAMWALGIRIYLRATQPQGRAGVWAFWGSVSVLTALWLASLAGSPPPSVAAVAVANSVMIGMIFAWACWVDRRRIPLE